MRLRGLVLTGCLVVGAGVAQAAYAARPAITGIAYARFYSNDMTASEQFYGKTLGLKAVGSEDGGKSYAVGLLQRIDLVPAATDATANRMAAVGFLTPDLAGMQTYLAAHGLEVVKVGADEIRVHDPEGNVVAFVGQGGVKKATAAVEGLDSGKAGGVTSTRMIHAGFLVHSEAKEDAFWKDVLGFRPYWHGGFKEGVTDWSSLQVPDGTDWVEYMLMPNGGTPDAKQMGGMDHVSLGVDHIQDANKQLEANGLEDASKRKSQIGRDGKWQLNVFDPDLTRIEFMEFNAVEKPCCSPFTGKAPSQKDAD